MNINRLDPECTVHTGSRGYLLQIIPNSVATRDTLKVLTKIHLSKTVQVTAYMYMDMPSTQK